jgi:hypothetical protein
MGFDQTIKAGLRTNYLTAQELELASKIAYRKFYYRPKYILKKFFKIRSREDVKRNINGFLGLINILKQK